MTAGSESRLRFLSFFILLVAIGLISRLYFVQIVVGSTYKERAEHQYVAGANYFDRGSIFFSTKDGSLIPAATIKTGFTLAINPSILSKQTSLDKIYAHLNDVVEIDKTDFLTRAGKTGDNYEEILKRLPQDIADKIDALKIPGVSMVRERWRMYPGGETAAHTVGLIGYKGDELSGRYGLERYYEKTLTRVGDGAFVNFFAEIFTNIKKTLSSDEALEGDVVTTIEPTVQNYLETELNKVNEKYSSEFTAGIVINPNNGEIVAMGEMPTFDPNNPQKEKDASIFSNKFVENRYEFGSIVKAMTMASGIDSGAITPRTTYTDPGCMTLNTKKFCNFDGKARGPNTTMQTVLNNSLNTGAAFIVSKMGNDKFSDYMYNFGLDQKTGVDLPNEGISLVSNLKTLRDLEEAQASFGQGIALTPVVMVRALSAIANGGTLITPHLGKEIEYKIGGSKTIEYPAEEDRVRVIQPQTSEEVSRMLTELVDRALRYGNMHLDHYSIAAKTGTAQIANPAGGGYYQDRYLHSFFGYFPAYDPKFLIFLYTYYPKGVQYASETLTDTFFDMTKFLINYYDIPPDREVPPPSTNTTKV